MLFKTADQSSISEAHEATTQIKAVILALNPFPALLPPNIQITAVLFPQVGYSHTQKRHEQHVVTLLEQSSNTSTNKVTRAVSVVCCCY